MFTHLPYAPPSPEALGFIARHSPIVEIGAGDGTWARALRSAGAVVRAFDLEPRGGGVEFGDHAAAARHDGALLMIWPPDGKTAQAWIDAKPWPKVVIIGCMARMHLDLSAYTVTDALTLPYGRKGSNELRAHRRLDLAGEKV